MAKYNLYDDSLRSILFPVSGGTDTLGLYDGTGALWWKSISVPEWITCPSYDDYRAAYSADFNLPVTYSAAQKHERTGTLSFRLYDGNAKTNDTKTITVRQYGRAPLSVSTPKVLFERGGGEKSVWLERGGYPGDVEIISELDWITVDHDSERDVIDIRATANTSVSERTGTVFFKTVEYESVPATITVTQAAAVSLTLSETSASVFADAGEKVVSVTTEGEVGKLTVNSDSQWVSAKIDGGNLVVSYSENGYETERTAVVTVSSGIGLSVVFTIVQKALHVEEEDDVEEWRVIPVEYGDMSCCLLFERRKSGEITARLFNATDGAIVAPGFIPAPFKRGANLMSISFIQSFDVVFFAQPDTFPCKLVRKKRTGGYSDGEYSWSFVDCEIMPKPVLDWEVKSEHALTLSAFPDSELTADGDHYFKGAVREFDGKFYQALTDVLTSVDVKNTTYYTPFSGRGGRLLLQIDGAADSESVGVGSYLALKSASPISESGMLSYEESYEDTVYFPAVELDEKLESKKDYDGEELRPESGGGVGFASPWYLVRGEVTLKTEGLWSGVLRLQELTKDGDVFDIATIISENGNSNTELTREIEGFDSAVRVVCTRREYAYQINRSVSGEGKVYEKVLKTDEGCQWTLTSAAEPTTYVRIVDKTTITTESTDESGNVISESKDYYVVECENAVSAPLTTHTYALGGWSGENGYPSQIAVYQERLVYASNKIKPTTLWLSRTNHWDDFEIGVNDSSAISATIATEKYDAIKWILPVKNGITVGTNYGEFSFGSADGGVTTADNARATATSEIGSTDVRAEVFGTATIMVKTGGQELYRIDYNTLSEESAGNQVSLLACHLFEGDPVIDLFSVRAPSNMLFCLHESGKLSSLTYEPEYGVTGWARHYILDGVKSGCVLRRNGHDVLCLIVDKGDNVLLGEIDLQSDVWTDDGKPYESAMISTPLVFDGNGSYGKQVNIAGCDVYVGAGTKQFDLRLNGGDWVRIDNGFDLSGELRDFDAKRVEVAATSAWVDEAIVEVKSSYAYPLVLHAIGASVRG